MKIKNSKTRHGCQRNGAERRKFDYTIHIPERRSGQERRRNTILTTEEDIDLKDITHN